MYSPKSTFKTQDKLTIKIKSMLKAKLSTSICIIN